MNELTDDEVRTVAAAILEDLPLHYMPEMYDAELAVRNVMREVAKLREGGVA